MHAEPVVTLLKKHKGEDFYLKHLTGPMVPFGRREELNGFKNENERTLRFSRPEATVDYEENYCYKYDELKFDNKSPDEFEADKSNEKLALFPPPALALEPSKKSGNNQQAPQFPQSDLKPGECGKVCKELEGKSYCKQLCADAKSGTFVKVFVGVVLPDVAPSGVNAFDLCQGGQCINATVGCV